MLKSNQIFIHIPKTGGTTLNCLLFDTENPINPSYNYRHIVYETKMSNSGVLFNPLKNDKFLGEQIFMMLRHPVDRIISEYYFLKERAEFFNLLKPVPKTFKDYVKHRQTHNYNISFLLGKKIYCKETMTIEDYNMVINAIEKLDIKIGIFEQFEKTLNFFSSEFDIKIPKEVVSKRITLKRPKSESIGKDLVAEILKNNELDLKLYNYALNKFDKVLLTKKQKIKFKGTKYDYAMVYSNRFSLFETTLKGEEFVLVNKTFFKDLSLYLHTLNIKDAKHFFDVYIITTWKTLKNTYSKLDFSELDSQLKNIEPLQKIELMSNFISKNKKQFKKALKFDKNQVNYIRKNNFINRIIKKIF